MQAGALTVCFVHARAAAGLLQQFYHGKLHELCAVQQQQEHEREGSAGSGACCCRLATPRLPRPPPCTCVTRWRGVSMGSQLRGRVPSSSGGCTRLCCVTCHAWLQTP
jgi:hypothetical protein